MEIILPDMTIIAQPIVVGVDRNIKRYEENAVNGFINFLFSDAGQEILAGYEFRPPNYQGERFPPLQGTFKVSELGGWPAAYNTILESIWKAEIEPELDLRAPLRLENGGED
jgi:ABC-type sulfate transport system substrate-binding protein